MNVKICKVCGLVGLDQMDFRVFYHNQNGRYYYRVMCKECTRKKLNTGGKGRPVGYAVTKESKDKMIETKLGYQHTLETRDKISASLLKYFDNLYPFSEELLKEYSKLDVDGEIAKFVAENKEELDSFDDIKAHRRMESRRYYEKELQEWGKDCVSDTRTPELLLLLKEEIEE